jgi:hypothetical protein
MIEIHKNMIITVFEYVNRGINYIMDELQPLKYMYNTVHMYSNAAGKL